MLVFCCFVHVFSAHTSELVLLLLIIRFFSASACIKCESGKHGTKEPGVCQECPEHLYQDDKGESACKHCAEGRIPNEKNTACKRPEWTVAADCSYNLQFLNNSMSDKFQWKCETCPYGAVCPGYSTLNEIVTQNGFWRVPWANSTFVKCPYERDCIGVDKNYKKPEQDDEETNSDRNNTATDHTTTENVERCLQGTKGPMCSLCETGWNRDTTSCQKCTSNSFGIRVVIVIVIFLVLLFLLKMCKKRMESKWKKYKPLWMDVITIVSINVTFAQVNSSLPSVIEVQWPVQWEDFIRYFNFVNIDLMSLIGISCIGDFNFFISFSIMMCLPISILLIAIFNYHFSHQMMKHRLATLTPVQKLTKEREALHELFDLVDIDHSGNIDPKELQHILHQLGWEVDTMSALEVTIAIGGETDISNGSWKVTEKLFIDTMLSGKLHESLCNLEVQRKQQAQQQSHKNNSIRRSLSVKGISRHKVDNSIHRSHSMKGKVKKDYTADREQLVIWTLRAQIIASSLAGSTQLLLLAHTPVSRKVFQYFHCMEISGKYLLNADYNISCQSTEYFAFLPVVLVVLGGYTVFLPSVILFYLYRHRHELYSTHVVQRIGWLYSRFARGAVSSKWLLRFLLAMSFPYICSILLLIASFPANSNGNRSSGKSTTF